MGGWEVTHCFFIILGIKIKFVYICIYNFQILIMKDIGDYLYIILLIVFSLASFLNKKKKAKNTSKPKPVILSEDVDQDWFPSVEEKPVYKAPNNENQQTINWPTFNNSQQEKQSTRKNTEVITDSYETTSDYSKIKPKKQVKTTSSEFKKAFFNEEANEISDLEYNLETIDDVRRAIIYSEIINRKY